MIIHIQITDHIKYLQLLIKIIHLIDLFIERLTYCTGNVMHILTCLLVQLLRLFMIYKMLKHGIWSCNLRQGCFFFIITDNSMDRHVITHGVTGNQTMPRWCDVANKVHYFIITAHSEVFYFFIPQQFANDYSCNKVSCT